MEEIRFDSEVLNKLMAEKTGKESFTREEVRKELRYIELNLQGEQITQEDVNLLVEINKVLILKDADLSKVKLVGLQVDEVRISNCNISAEFFEDSEIKSVQLGAEELANGGLEKLSRIKNVTNVTLFGRSELNAETILNDYPNFDSLEIGEKIDIISDPYYKKPQLVDLSDLKNLSGLESLDIRGIDISQHNADEIAKVKGLRSLDINSINLEANVVIPPISSLEKLEFSGNIQSMKSVAEQKTLKKLSIVPHRKSCENVSGLRNFTNLERLELYGIDDVEDNLPNSIGMQELILSDCGIEDAPNSILNKYSQLTKMHLDRNPLGKTSITDMIEAKKARNIDISFLETRQYDELSSKSINVASDELEAKLKNFLGIHFSKGHISQYDLLVASPSNWCIRDPEMLNEIVRLGILDISLNNVKSIDVDSLDSLTPETQEALIRSFKGKIELKTLKGMSTNTIKKFGEIKFDIAHDLHGEYTSEELVPVLEVMEQIKSQIPENASEYEKFNIVYNIIGKAANYDYSGCIDNEQHVEGAEAVTRSLEGVLIHGRAVCAGYALALEQCLKYVGIDAKYISGMAEVGEESGGHAWNQVCIDGKWYNADLTWDAQRIQRGMPLQYCLMGDKMFEKEHTASSYQDDKIHKCDDDYLLNEVGVMANKPTKTTFGKGVPTLFGTEDFKTVAQETVIEQSVVDNLKEEIKRNTEQQKSQQANER